MNDKTRVAKPVEKVQDDGDTTIFVDRDNTGANDHPPVGNNPGLIPSAAAGFTADATVLAAGAKGPDATRIATPAREAVFFEPSSSRSGAVTKTVIKGRFELDKLLGVGGMGAVYKALDRRKVEASDSEPYVAIKLLNDDFRQHPDAFISLQREARKSQTLAHPNIVTVYDFDREGDRVFMTMEFLEGAPLDKLIRDHAGVGLKFELACSTLKDIAQALIYAHSHSIVHSDFKPGNIFVTSKKGAKVFDFGIARAVSEGSVSDKVGEKTLFDASTLGALTPAYASLEMLQGSKPAPSDDVYALGCVAYELFSGQHPFGKTPADQAQQRKLKPQRIRSLSRRQWRALESALAFRRRDRTATVEDFVRGFFGSNTWKWALGGAFSAMLVAAGAGYYYLERENVAEQERVRAALEERLQRDLQQELLQSRISDKREAIDRLITLSFLTPSWEENLQEELLEYAELNPADSDYRESSELRISELFVSAANGQLSLGNLEQADEMLARAAVWHQEADGAAQVQSQLSQQREALRERLEAERLEAEREAEQLHQAELQEQLRLEAQRKQAEIDVVLNDMETALRCRFAMDISGGVARQLNRLAAIDPTKAQRLRPVLAAELHTCIGGLAARNPVRTEPLLLQARHLLPEQQLLQDFKLNYCGHLSPGSGGRGARYACADRLADGTEGPSMVVVPGTGRTPLVISRFEVSNGEFRQFCIASGTCEGMELGADSQPVNNITLPQADSYLAWLSAQTGYDYRLPTEREWFAAASPGGEPEVADRNCHLRYGGMERGTELVAAQAGSQNRFGLVNIVGNLQEWVYSADGRLMAAGGHRLDPMSRCLATTKRYHSGEADSLTGFRVVRDLH